MDLCLHRGHPISGGKCPYHGLSHPALASCFFRGLKRSKRFDTKEFDSVRDRMKSQFQSITQMVKAPWWIWMQNTADFHHLRSVHGSGFSKLFHGEPFDVQISADKTKSSHKILIEHDVVKRYRRILGDSLKDFFYHALVYPRLSVTSFMDLFFSVEVAEPGETNDYCMVTTEFYWGEIHPTKLLIDAAMESNRRILDEDRRICESWAPTAAITGNWMRGEERVRAYCDTLESRGHT